MRTVRLANFYLEIDELEKESPVKFNEITVLKDIKSEWEQGKPVITLLSPSIQSDILKILITKTARACLKWQPGPYKLSEASVSKLEHLTEDEISDIKTLVLKVPTEAKNLLEQKYELDENTSYFIIYNVSRIVLKGFANRVLKELDLGKWQRGFCPICGDFPSMAKLTEKNGTRKLYCSRCETEWRFPRIGCPFCGNQDSDKLWFLSPEQYQQYRVYLCESCKGYLKTVDERQSGEVDLFCEDIATADLDKLARLEGYRSKNWGH